MVFEQEPYWAPELRRQFEGEGVSVKHCTDLGSVGGREAGDADVLVASLEGNERECVELLRQVPQYFKIFISSLETAQLERPLREAGVSSFVVEHLSGQQLARRIRRIWSTPE